MTSLDQDSRKYPKLWGHTKEFFVIKLNVAKRAPPKQIGYFFVLMTKSWGHVSSVSASCSYISVPGSLVIQGREG